MASFGDENEFWNNIKQFGHHSLKVNDRFERIQNLNSFVILSKLLTMDTEQNESYRHEKISNDHLRESVKETLVAKSNKCKFRLRLFRSCENV